MNSTEGKKKNFNFIAFLLCGVYYIGAGYFIPGLIMLIITIIVPASGYFIIGLCCGFISNNLKSNASVLSISLAVLSCVLFVVLKLVRIYYTGGM